MSQILAPYNNAMRLGQGFNSYTHQICLHDAVEAATADTHQSIETTTPGTSTTSSSMLPTQEDSDNSSDTPQIVTYYTRFVDKISDVVDSMNISAALSISTNTIGGQASGSYIDSDKFKESDMNYFVQVKVSNQKKVDPRLSKLHLVAPVKIPPASPNGDSGQDPKNAPEQLILAKFREIYGDCFISGWEEGGELNALISVKVKNKAKIHEIKGQIEGHLGTPALQGTVKGEIDLKNNNSLDETETTISVSWSGGGQIKDRDVLWDVNSLTLAAVNFPDQVRKCPQKIYAILTKYTSLPDFQERVKSFSAIDYDIAATYTNALLDAYTDYKAVWKALQITSSDFEARRCRVEQAVIQQETDEFLTRYVHALSTERSSHVQRIQDAASKPDQAVPQLSATAALVPEATLGAVDDRSDKGSKAITSPPPSNTQSTNARKQDLFQPYPASLVGLQAAKVDCRLQMVRIVQEVDRLTVDPALALRADAGDLLPPSIFRQLLPVVLGPPDADSEWSDVLGTAKIASKLSTADFSSFPDAARSVKQYEARAYRTRMSRWAGLYVPNSTNMFNNDVGVSEKGRTVKSLSIWSDSNRIRGLAVDYSDGVRSKHGALEDGGDIKRTDIQWGNRIVIGVQIGLNADRSIGHIAFNWSDFRVDMVTCANLKGIEQDDLVVNSIRPTEARVGASDKRERIWDLGGFYSSYNKDTGCFEALGTVWVAEAPKPTQNIMPAGLDFAIWLRNKMDKFTDAGFGRDFRLSLYAGLPGWDEQKYKSKTMADSMDYLAEVPSARLVKLDTWYTVYDNKVMMATLRATYDRNIIENTNMAYFGYMPADTSKPHFTEDLNETSEFALSKITAVALASGITTMDSKMAFKEFNYQIKRTKKSSNSVDYLWRTTTAQNMSPAPSTTGTPPYAGPPIVATPPESDRWCLKGFYAQWGSVIDSIGLVWGRDDV